VKTLAFACGLGIAAVGAAGFLAPSLLVWIARLFVSGGELEFLLLAAVRIGFGLVLISAAAASRAPGALRILGYAIVALGTVTAVTGLAGLVPAQRMIEQWLEYGSGIVRLTAIPIVLLGGFVAWSAAPVRGTSSVST
jgi:hypothetical protein